MAEAGVYSPLGERPEGGLYGKLVLLTGVRLAVGTALLGATAWSTLRHDPFPRTVEALLVTIIALIYFAALVGTFLLRTRRYLGWVAHGQIAADIIAATGLVYLTGGAESIFTVLYPLAIVSGAIGLGRRGAALGAAACCVALCVLAWGMQSGMLTVGEDVRITYLNPAAEHLTGLSDRDARGQPLKALLPDLAAAIGRPREPGRPEVRLRAHDGQERILGYATAPLAGGVGGM